jgi:predicted Zn-ribbon and HTH transcriptional regulator
VMIKSNRMTNEKLYCNPGDIMKKKTAEPFIPIERHDTIRHEIMALLQQREMSAREISMEMGISEKDVLDNLEHIRVMLHRSGTGIVVKPAICGKCGFVFRKRERLSKPGKCPVCRGELIEEPLFSIGR